MRSAMTPALPAKVTPLNEGWVRKPITTVESRASQAGQAIVPVAPRADITSVQAYGRGSKRTAIEIAADQNQLNEARAGLEARVHAPSNAGPAAYRLHTWRDVATAAGHDEPFSADPNVLYDVTSALWAAGFRSLDLYLNAARQDMHA